MEDLMCLLATVRTLNEAVVDKIIVFHKIAHNFTYSQKSVILKVFWKEIDQLSLLYQLYGRDIARIYFFIFGSCETLSQIFSLVSVQFVTSSI